MRAGIRGGLREEGPGGPTEGEGAGRAGFASSRWGVQLYFCLSIL